MKIHVLFLQPKLIFVGIYNEDILQHMRGGLMQDEMIVEMY